MNELLLWMYIYVNTCFDHNVYVTYPKLNV
jgi:hypothetical protein